MPKSLRCRFLPGRAAVGALAPRLSLVGRAALLAAVAAACGREDGLPNPAQVPEPGPAATIPWALGRWTPGTPPRFEDFPADAAFEGAPAPPDLSSHPEATARAELLRDAVARGANFAGHFSIAAWREPEQAGTSFLVVDVRTGRVLDGRMDAPAMDFRVDSRLIRYAPPEPLPGRVRCAGCTESFDLWDGGRLHPIPAELWAPSAPPPDAWRALVAQLRDEEEPAALLGHSPHVVRPTWDRLVITAEDGTRRVLSDDVVQGELQSIHQFAGSREPLPAYVVVRQLVPEGREVLMVDRRTAGVTRLDEIPSPAPDGARFATASADLVAGHAPNRIRVYRMEPQGPALDWELEPRGWGARDPVWLDANTVRMERVVVDWNTHGVFSSPMLLRRAAGGWTLEHSADHARDALLSFLSALGRVMYIEAPLLYGGSYDQLRGWNPDHDPGDRSGLWRLGCENNGLQCLGRAEILGAELISSTEARFTVRLLDAAGKPFVLGPCCGETEQTMPPRREFTFRVRRVGTDYLVMDPPPYVP
jgi:hypothetical protein